MSDTETRPTILPDETDIVLAGMFTENTGTNFLDSGGAYGRNFERNAGRDAVDFLAATDCGFTRDTGLFIDSFHFCRERLTFNADAQDEFEAWIAAEHGDDNVSFFELVDEYCTERWGAGNFGVTNTYNHESALTTVLQFWVVDTDEDPSGEWVYGELCVLMVHGGCDVRGGYTAPKFFDISGEEACMWDDTRAMIYCSGHTHTPPQVEALPGFPDTPAVEVSHQWMTDDAGYHWYGEDSYGDRAGTPDYSTSYGSDDPELEFAEDGSPICPVEGCTGTVFASTY